MYRFLLIIMVVICCCGFVKVNASDPVVIDIRGEDSLKLLVNNIVLDHDLLASFSPPVSQSFKDGYIVARTLHKLGVVKFLHLEGGSHPCQKLKHVESLPVRSSNISQRLKSEIAGFNAFMWDEAVKIIKGKRSEAPKKEDQKRLLKEVDEAWEAATKLLEE